MQSFQDYNKTLVQQAEEPIACRVVDNSLPLSRYIQAAKQLIKQANNFKKDQNYEQCYIYSIRFITLFVNCLQKHHDANSMSFRKDMFQLRQVFVIFFLQTE